MSKLFDFPMYGNIKLSLELPSDLVYVIGDSGVGKSLMVGTIMNMHSEGIVQEAIAFNEVTLGVYENLTSQEINRILHNFAMTYRLIVLDNLEMLSDKLNDLLFNWVQTSDAQCHFLIMDRQGHHWTVPPQDKMNIRAQRDQNTGIIQITLVQAEGV